MPGKRVQFDDATWAAIDLLMRTSRRKFQDVADEAFHKLATGYGYSGSPRVDERAKGHELRVSLVGRIHHRRGIRSISEIGDAALAAPVCLVAATRHRQPGDTAARHVDAGLVATAEHLHVASRQELVSDRFAIMTPAAKGALRRAQLLVDVMRDGRRLAGAQAGEGACGGRELTQAQCGCRHPVPPVRDRMAKPRLKFSVRVGHRASSTDLVMERPQCWPERPAFGCMPEIAASVACPRQSRQASGQVLELGTT